MIPFYMYFTKIFNTSTNNYMTNFMELRFDNFAKEYISGINVNHFRDIVDKSHLFESTFDGALKN